jgi:glutamate racemase
MSQTLVADAASTPGSIGLFDSGLGGLTVLRELKLSFPWESFTYLGDTARTPYGAKGAETVIRYSKECARFLSGCEIKLLVVACNTASSLALSHLAEECSFPVIGTVDPAVRTALGVSRNEKIGVIGTNATVKSGAYETALKRINPQVMVVSKPCPLFVPVVEEGMFDGTSAEKGIVKSLVEFYLSPLKESGVDTLVLGCTHYPLLLSAIAEYMGPEVNIVECSKAIAEDVRKLLPVSSSSGRNPQSRFFVTDEAARFSQLANIFLGSSQVQAVKVQMVD